MSPQGAVSTILNEEFVSLRAKNPSYSLRAFAKRLQLSPSALSEILNGKRKISRNMAAKLADRLMLTPERKNRLLKIFPEKKQPALKAEKALVQLNMDHFHAISDWYYFAILSLAETDNFKSDIDWIARRLGLNKNTTHTAIDRLLRLEMLEEDRKGNWRPTGVTYTTSDEINNVSLRFSHLQGLELAKASLENDPTDQRDFMAITMAIDPKKIPEAKKRIRKFRDDLCAYLESGNKSEVYRFCMQLIPLTRQEKSNERSQKK